MDLEHDTEYHASVKTSSSSGNIGDFAFDMVLRTDHTIPPNGTLHNLFDQSVHYTSVPYYVLPGWSGFEDPESGIYRYYLSLVDEGDPWNPVIPEQEFTPDFDSTYWPTDLEPGHNYTIRMRSRNQAGLIRETVSDWFLFDDSAPALRSVSFMDHWHVDTDILSLDMIAAMRNESATLQASDATSALNRAGTVGRSASDLWSQLD